ncbi:metal-sulfur cluster biosynthetic enzyme [Ochrobactrum sp. BH3]|nr:metal-sulfur cluster biosynthetic enzyme [Ochrobactrum sp. BH3]
MQSENDGQLEYAILDALRLILDPELGVNLVDLGMIYHIEIVGSRTVNVQMTTTTPGCPAAGFLIEAVQTCVEAVDGVSRANIELTYEPPWMPEMALPEVQSRFTGLSL